MQSIIPRGVIPARGGPGRPRSGVEIGGRIEAEQLEPPQQPPKVCPPPVLAGAGRDLHHDGLVTASGPADAINALRPRSTGPPGARSYSTHADVSARITRAVRAGER